MKKNLKIILPFMLNIVAILCIIINRFIQPLPDFVIIICGITMLICIFLISFFTVRKLNENK